MDNIKWTDIDPIEPEQAGKCYSLGSGGELVKSSIPWIAKSRMTLRSGSMSDFAKYLNAQPPGKAASYQVPTDWDPLTRPR